MTLGYQMPAKPEQFKNVVVIWTSELNDVGLSPEMVERGFRRYAREGFGLWPTLSSIISNSLGLPDLEREFERIQKIVRSLPVYTGSEYSRRQIEIDWSRKIERAYPDGLPRLVAEGLKAVGGRDGLKRKMREDNSSASMVSVSRLFKAAARSSAINSGAARLEDKSSLAIEVKR